MKTNHHHRTPPFVPLLVELPGPAGVFGGGSVGMRKAAVLASAHVVSSWSMPQTRAVLRRPLLCMHVTDASFKEGIPEDASLVVCALDDTQLNARITTYCRMQGILVTNA
jgi:siroheme synthase (precorrin-2 oxidase/ferrochelatase)